MTEESNKPEDDDDLSPEWKAEIERSLSPSVERALAVPVAA